MACCLGRSLWEDRDCVGPKAPSRGEVVCGGSQAGNEELKPGKLPVVVLPDWEGEGFSGLRWKNACVKLHLTNVGRLKCGQNF